MTRRPKNPTSEFSLGYQAGRAAEARLKATTAALEIDRLKSIAGILETRLQAMTERAEGAEKALVVANKKLERLEAKVRK